MTILALQDLDERSIASVELRRDLRLVRIHGPSLARLGVTAEWRAAAIARHPNFGRGHSWEHADRPDGILYRSRHDDSALCVAVYDRAKDGLAIVGDNPLTADPQQLAGLLKRYRVGLTR